MVRIIIGTLIEIGAGKMQISQIEKLFETKERTGRAYSTTTGIIFRQGVLFCRQSVKMLSKSILTRW